MNKVQLLTDLAAEIRTCPKCVLATTRTNAVPGEGSVAARIMFVGEGPGEKEDLQGRPFVGQAGTVLNRLLTQAGIDRSDVFITNIVKCRPPGNRVPRAEEVEACSDYLMAQIAIIEPTIVVPLGGSSLKTLLGKDLSISTARRKVFRKSGILYIPLYHPAASLHNPGLISQLQADIEFLKEIINRPILESEIIELHPTSVTAHPPAAPKKSAPFVKLTKPVVPAMPRLAPRPPSSTSGSRPAQSGPTVTPKQVQPIDSGAPGTLFSAGDLPFQTLEK